MIVSSHLVLALLLVFGGLCIYRLPIKVQFVCRHGVCGVVGAQLEVVALEFLQLLLIELCDLCVIPGSEEYLVGGGKMSLIVAAETGCPSMVIGSLWLVALCLLTGVVLVVDGLEVLAGVPQLEMRRSLIHLLYLSRPLLYYQGICPIYHEQSIYQHISLSSYRYHQ